MSALVERDPRGVRRMIARLSELLRTTLEGGKEQEVPLREELRFLDGYLDIMRVRFQGQLSVEMRIADGLGAGRRGRLVRRGRSLQRTGARGEREQRQGEQAFHRGAPGDSNGMHSKPRTHPARGKELQARGGRAVRPPEPARQFPPECTTDSLGTPCACAARAWASSARRKPSRCCKRAQ